MKTTLKLIRNGARNRGYLFIHMLSQSCNTTPLCLSTSILTDIIRSDCICSEWQGILDSVVTKQPCTPPFTSAGLLDYIVELVVSEDDICVIYSCLYGVDMDQNIWRLSSSLTEAHSVVYSLMSVPHCPKRISLTKPSSEQKYLSLPKPLRKELRLNFRFSLVSYLSEPNAHIIWCQNTPGQISTTFNTWTSSSGELYLSVTGHYIDSPPECPQDWTLQTEQLAFAPFKGNHSGPNMSKILVRTINHYGIYDKVNTWGSNQ